MKILRVVDGVGEVIISRAEKAYQVIPKRGKRERDKRIAVVKEELAELKEMEEGKEIEEEVGEQPSVVTVEEDEEEISEKELEEKIRMKEELDREFMETKKDREREEDEMREKISTMTMGKGHVVVDTGEGTETKTIVRHDLKGPFLTRFKKFIKVKKTKK